MNELPELNLKDKVSEREWRSRVDLAAAYRLAVMYGWNDIIYTHISVRIPDTDEYLINAFGLTFDEITASNLVKIDIDGNIIQDDCPFEINPAGYTIHSAVHKARHEVICVIHNHQVDAIAVASQKFGLLPLSQYSAFALASLSYHRYEGLAVDSNEVKRIQDDLDANNFMLLPNHGALTCGVSVGDAFMHMYDLIQACKIQCKAVAFGTEFIELDESVIEGIKAQADIVHTGTTGGQKAWPAMLRLVKRTYPDFDQ